MSGWPRRVVGGADAAAAGAQVVLLSKGSRASSNSYLAQGGVAAALAADDSPQLHAHDTLAAGRGLCQVEVEAAEVRGNRGRRRLPVTIDNTTPPV